jgi:hypothetical protein
MTDEFSVLIEFPGDAGCQWVARFVGAEEAVLTARDYSRRPAALAGFIARIAIIDSMDCTVFEWLYGKGVTFPPQQRDERNGKFS